MFLVVLGGPGTGKTHFALELTVRILAQEGGDGAIHMYYGLDQPPEEIHAKLREDFQYYGVSGQWNHVTGTIRGENYRATLHSIQTQPEDKEGRYFLCASLQGADHRIESSESLFRRLDEDIEAITRLAPSVGKPLVPRLVTIDNISLSAFDDGDDVRHALQKIRARLVERRMHGIFLVETPGADSDRGTFSAAEYAADVILQLGYHEFGDQFKERSLEIAKARHQFYFRGTHHFSIAGKSGEQLRGARGQRSPGIHVYPSTPTLLSYLQYHREEPPAAADSLPFGYGEIQVRATSANGLLGSPRRLASLYWLTMQFLMAEPGTKLLVSFQQRGEEILDQADQWFPDSNLRDQVKCLSFSPEYISAGKFLKDVFDELESFRRQGHEVTRVAVAGLEHLRWGFPLLNDAKMLIPWLTVFFRSQSITSLFVESTFPTASDNDSPGESAMADTVDNLLVIHESSGGTAHLKQARGFHVPGWKEQLTSLPDLS